MGDLVYLDRGNAATPTAEPYDVPLTREQRASIDVRLSARQAAESGVAIELVIAEVRFAYGMVS
ncbi:MAG: hypothetical protein ACRDYZ_07920 [Acidimicrobiales bacterium]